MPARTVQELSLKDQRVLLRVDFNVPLEEDGSIADDSRIRAALPTIEAILEQKPKCLILISHLGRPKGRVDPTSTLAPCATHLSQLLKKDVHLAPDCVGEKITSMVNRGGVVLLENVRFHPGEEHPERERGFVEALAALGDCYVNDAFGTAHRKHASTYELPKRFQGKRAMGLLMKKEMEALTPLLSKPNRPFFLILGGSKIESKAGLIEHLLEKIDGLFLGGAMAFPFLKALGLSIGDSFLDEKEIPIAQSILKKARKMGVDLHLPSDFFAEKEGEPPSIFPKQIPAGWKGMDVGTSTLLQWESLLKEAQTIFWNGPMGVFEKPPFDRGTQELAKILIDTKAHLVAGGGDSLAAIDKIGLSNHFSHLSTGGGASLEFLEFGTLPGIEILS